MSRVVGAEGAEGEGRTLDTDCCEGIEGTDEDIMKLAEEATRAMLSSYPGDCTLVAFLQLALANACGQVQRVSRVMPLMSHCI